MNQNDQQSQNEEEITLNDREFQPRSLKSSAASTIIKSILQKPEEERLSGAQRLNLSAQKCIDKLPLPTTIKEYIGHNHILNNITKIDEYKALSEQYFGENNLGMQLLDILKNPITTLDQGLMVPTPMSKLKNIMIKLNINFDPNAFLTTNPPETHCLSNSRVVDRMKLGFYLHQIGKLIELHLEGVVGAICGGYLLSSRFDSLLRGNYNCISPQYIGHCLIRQTEVMSNNIRLYDAQIFSILLLLQKRLELWCGELIDLLPHVYNRSTTNENLKFECKKTMDHIINSRVADPEIKTRLKRVMMRDQGPHAGHERHIRLKNNVCRQEL